jgi:hypothetical protein
MVIATSTIRLVRLMLMAVCGVSRAVVIIVTAAATALFAILD